MWRTKLKLGARETDTAIKICLPESLMHPPKFRIHEQNQGRVSRFSVGLGCAECEVEQTVSAHGRHE